MAAKVYAKYLLEPEGRDVHGRFTALYNSSRGKQLLLAQCVAGGQLLKECGLLELASSICESEAYITATTPSQRRAILLGELMGLTGGASAVAMAAPAAHSAIREPIAPTATPEAAGEQPEPAEAAGAQDENLTPQVKARPQMRTTGTELPNIGASSAKK